MRIISKFHDYYDSAQGYGQDPNLLYRRETDELVFRPWGGDPRITQALDEVKWSELKLGVLAFCGRIFPIWFPEALEVTVENLCKQTTEKMWLAPEEVEELLNSQEESMMRRKYWWDSAVGITRRVAPYHGLVIGAESFRLVSAPAFLCLRDGSSWPRVTNLKVIRNPRLVNLGLQKLIDPFSAFQEIAMYLGSALTAEDTAPRTVGDDRIIARAKGFDDQSFRTAAPGQKKLQRAENRKRKRGLKDGSHE
jgi:hypothetical protein